MFEPEAWQVTNSSPGQKFGGYKWTIGRILRTNCPSPMCCVLDRDVLIARIHCHLYAKAFAEAANMCTGLQS